MCDVPSLLFAQPLTQGNDKFTAQYSAWKGDVQTLLHNTYEL